MATIPVVSAPREWEMGNGKWARSAIASAYGLRLTADGFKRCRLTPTDPVVIARKLARAARGIK